MPLSAADRALGTLGGISRRFALPAMVIRPLQRREALTSSSMEGTHASPDDLVLLEAGAERGGDGAAREVLNYITALDEAVASLKELPISWRLISAVHRTLLSGVGAFRGAHKRPGEFKGEQNFIGGRTLATARFIPPPPAEARDAMTALEHYLNRESVTLPAVLDAALIHYQFETIHPFGDGNGRVGRILIPLYLMQRGVLDAPILYVSPYIEQHKDEYIDAMYRVSATGEWEAWITFFLRAVHATCDDTIRTVDRLLSLQESYRARVRAASRTTSMLRIVESLFERPVLTVTEAAAIADISYPAAQAAVARLVDAGILREVTWLTGIPKRFIAPEVVQVSSGHFGGRDVDTSQPM